MKLRSSIEAVNIGMILSTIVTSAMVWPGLPDRLPVHWSGVTPSSVDGYGGKVHALFFYPAILLVTYPLLLFAHKIDPDRYDRVRSSAGWALVRLAITAFFSADYFAYVLYLKRCPVNFIAVDRMGLLGLGALGAACFVWQMVQHHRRPSTLFEGRKRNRSRPFT